MKNLVLRWVDNNTVLMVTTSHNPRDVIERARRRPRLTDTNRRHIAAVLGNSSTMNVEIPLIIDDFNRCMGGVD